MCVTSFGSLFFSIPVRVVPAKEATLVRLMSNVARAGYGAGRSRVWLALLGPETGRERGEGHPTFI